jgi:DNA-binding NtrC family response regulator
MQERQTPVPRGAEMWQTDRLLPRHRAVVIVVADDPFDRDLLGQSLTILGFRVLLAASVPAGVERLCATPETTAVVIDAPAAADCVATMDALRSVRPDVPVVLFAGELPRDARRALRQDGNVEILTKPISFGQMESAVRKASRPWRSPSSPSPLSP